MQHNRAQAFPTLSRKRESAMALSVPTPLDMMGKNLGGELAVSLWPDDARAELGRDLPACEC